MTVIEQRFMESAMSFFSHMRKSEFIELTSAEKPSVKMMVNKRSVTFVASDGKTTCVYFGQKSCFVAESYEDVKKMLKP